MAENSDPEIESSFGEISQPVEGESDNMETGENFGHIRHILAKFTEKCLAPARFEKISSCLAEVREKNPTVFDSIVPQLIEHLQVNIKNEIELMFEQENFVLLCHQLEQIIQASEGTDVAWRPSGLPSEDIKDHVMQVKLEFREKLREKLQQLKDENQALENNLTSRAREIADTERRIIAKHDDLQKISTSCEVLTSSNNNEDNKYSLKNIIKELDS